MPRFTTAALLLTLTLPLAAQQLPIPTNEQTQLLGAQLFTDSGSTGMVLVVVRPHDTHTYTYGETVLGNHTLPDANSLLRLCSLTKIFTTDLLVKLADDDTIHLNDPLQRFASPHTLVPSRAGRSITLEDLATHTSGLPRELGNAPRDTPHFTFPDKTLRWRWLPRQRLRSTPGTAALYSNVGFDLLGDALQAATRQPYPALLAERTLTPLGMTATTYSPTPEQCARLLQTAHDEGPCTATTNTAGSSGLYSTATDMTRWLQYLLGTTQPAQSAEAEAVYLSPAALVSQQGLDHAGTVSGLGLGWMHLLADTEPNSIIEKTGGGAGFLTYIALNQHTHTGLFFALTDGAIETHFNAFKAANNLLLALSGFPPYPPDPPPPPSAPHHKTTTRHPRPHKKASSS